MLTIDGKQYRNLEEQVRKNKEDIQSIIDASAILNAFGIKVVGQVNTSDKLPNPAEYPGEYGDAYLVGTATPYDYYIFTRPNDTHPTAYWLNIGEFPLAGPKGDTGATGPVGPKGDGSKWYAGTQNPTIVAEVNDQYLNTTDGSVFSYSNVGWTRIGNIRGPQGIQGNIGPVGPQGAQGIQGQKGDKGDPGQSFIIAGELNSTSQLPDVNTTPRNHAYLVGTNDDLYAIVGTNDKVWTNVGKVTGVQGPKGDTGPQGPTGPTAGSNPNILINGDFRVNQRKFSTISGSTRTYTVDRWYYNVDSNTTGNVLTLNNDNSITIDNTNSNKRTIIKNYLEEKDYNNLINKYVTLSAKINGTLYTCTGMFTSIASGTFSAYCSVAVENSSLLRFVHNADDKISVDVWVNAGSSLNVEWVKLEIGNVATSFSPRPYAEELAMCQRYFQTINTVTSLLYARTNNQLRTMINFKAEMRTTPTLTQLNTIRVFGPIEGTTFTQTQTGISGGTAINREGAMIALLNFSGLTANNIYQFDLGVSTEPIFTVDAEIY